MAGSAFSEACLFLGELSVFIEALLDSVLDNPIEDFIPGIEEGYGSVVFGVRAGRDRLG